MPPHGAAKGQSGGHANNKKKGQAPLSATFLASLDRLAAMGGGGLLGNHGTKPQGKKVMKSSPDETNTGSTGLPPLHPRAKDYRGFRIPGPDWEIERVPASSLTAEIFYRRYVLGRIPCVITGIDQSESDEEQDEKPSNTQEEKDKKLEKWANDWLREKAGDCIVQVEQRQSLKVSSNLSIDSCL